MNIKASQWFVVFVVARLDFSQWRTSLCFPSRRSHDGVQAPYHWLGGDERERGRGGSKVGREILRTTWTPVQEHLAYSQEILSSRTREIVEVHSTNLPVSQIYIANKLVPHHLLK